MTIRVKDALELVSKQAPRVKLTLVQDEGYSLFYNLIATIRGTEFKNEEIILMAHYDSTPYRPGVYDNASGANLMI